MPPEAATSESRRSSEILAFLVLAVLVWPILAVALVGGWGLAVWIFQMIAGPPGPPPT